jgi:hypothetical protein
MKRILLASTILLLSCNKAVAQTPIDPLRRLQEEAGTFIYTFGGSYFPSGIKDIDFATDGSPYRFKTFDRNINLNFTGGYSFNNSIGISASVSQNFFARRRQDFFADGKVELSRESESSTAGSLGIEYRPAPNSGIDPRLSVSVAYPWTIEAQGQISLLRDPVILLASTGYSRSLGNDRSEFINFGIGAGFIANDTITFSGTANYAIPVDSISQPVTSLSFRTGYNLDASGGREISLRTTLATSTGDTRIGFGIEYSGRGTVYKKKDEPVSDKSNEPLPTKTQQSFNETQPQSANEKPQQTTNVVSLFAARSYRPSEEGWSTAILDKAAVTEAQPLLTSEIRQSSPSAAPTEVAPSNTQQETISPDETPISIKPGDSISATALIKKFNRLSKVVEDLSNQIQSKDEQIRLLQNQVGELQQKVTKIEEKLQLKPTPPSTKPVPKVPTQDTPQRPLLKSQGF